MSGSGRTLYRGGSVYSPADPFATAMLVDGGYVAWVGSDEAAAGHAATLSGRDAVVDLDGALITPAFVDAHVHVTETGLARSGLDLSAATSARQVLDAVAAAVRDRPGQSVLGWGWDETTWTQPDLPTRAALDAAAGGAPVYLARADVHSALVSTALAASADLAGRPGWGEDGLVRGDAHHAARDATRTLTPAHRRQVQRDALQAASAAGIGSVHECSAPHVGSPEDIRSLLDVAADPERPGPDVLVLWGMLADSDASVAAILADLAVPDPAADRAGQPVAASSGQPSVLLGLGGDLMLDGSIGSSTAAFKEPYAGPDSGPHSAPHSGPGTRASGTTASPLLDAAAVRDHVIATTRAGLQAGFHVIGDAALAVALDGFEQAARQVGGPALAAARHRLEHVEAADPQAIARLAALGVTASMQPAFDARWGGPDGMYRRRLGAQRAAQLNPFAAFAAAGVPLALGSDSPVTPLAPWEGVRAAAFTHVSEHRLSVRAAFLAATRGGWRAAGRDGQGVLTPGAPATYAIWAPSDLVVQAPSARVAAWSTDIRSGTPGLPDLTPGTAAPACLATVVRGAATFTDEAWASAHTRRVAAGAR